MTREAFAFARSFAPTGPTKLLVDRHYLLCASKGSLRLEAGGQYWLLPPARAALLRAGRPATVTIGQPATTASVLFHVDFVSPPSQDLTVFDLVPLARALLAECGKWQEAPEPLPAYARAIFTALAAVAWRSAERPSPIVMPVGRSAEVQTALRLTEERLGDEVRFEEVAAAVGLVPRSLARRFEAEVGMTWRATLRRMRVLRAVERLAADDTPVTTIAHDVGYGSLSAFNAAFHDLTGATPSGYRATFTA
ncbi:AraC family transcriptional regulator [Pedococcus sp. 5OH_020]|uniref:AraC family transcriptional regulator n=1 Tax=Pedococcus sp. 5OH_020 TaxID=2989814 RepID=UPI0022E9D5FD|nr:AraC family transcriptional regulator [Pedococcus sp. 5OH_020]